MKRLALLLVLFLLPAIAWSAKHPPDIQSSDLYTCDATVEGRILMLTDADAHDDCDTSGGGDFTAFCKCEQTGSGPTYAWRGVSENFTQMVPWSAGAMSAGLVNTECSAPTEVNVNSSGGMWTLACPMAGSEVDGFVSQSVLFEKEWDKTKDVTFDLTAYLTTDAGAGTWHGEIAIQCIGPGEIINNTWGTGIGLDLTPVAGDVVNDVIRDSSAAVDTDTTGADCDSGDLLRWRWKSCDTDATPSSGCTSSAGFEDDMSLLWMTMNVTEL